MIRIRPGLIISGCIACLTVACTTVTRPDDVALLNMDTMTLAAEISAGRVTAEQVTRAVLARIEKVDAAGPGLNAIIEVNPDALLIARELDKKFASRGPVGLLHGLPVVLKANIDTADKMATSAGSLALAQHHSPADAELVSLLRKAGAVIVAKANLSEWANFRSLHSSSGWSSVGGQTKNPYVLDRNPCGSSSGSAVAVAARLVPLAVGTETDGSIVCPASVNGVVGIKPTHGSVSQQGIIPISHSQDIAGPMARTVEGAALLLAVMQRHASSSGTSTQPAERSDLKGIRLGVLRDYFGANEVPKVDKIYTDWIKMLQEADAELIDPVKLEMPETVDKAELEVLLFEFKADMKSYLQNDRADMHSLSDLIQFNNEHADEVMPYFGQEIFTMAESHGDLDDPKYKEALEQSRDVLRDKLQKVFDNGHIDALIAPVSSPAWTTDWINGDNYLLASSSIAAISGYPSITVPGGLINELPVGIAFIGKPDSENLLIEIAKVFEHARGPLPPPKYLPSLEH